MELKRFGSTGFRARHDVLIDHELTDVFIAGLGADAGDLAVILVEVEVEVEVDVEVEVEGEAVVVLEQVSDHVNRPVADGDFAERARKIKAQRKMIDVDICRCGGRCRIRVDPLAAAARRHGAFARTDDKRDKNNERRAMCMGFMM